MVEANLPSCADCKQWVYNPDWSLSMRAGNKQPRPQIGPGSMTPCHRCPKIPKGATPCPESAVELSDRNRRAYWYSLQCAADPTGILPRDRIVIRNNAIIRQVERSLDQHRQHNLFALVALAATPKPGEGGKRV